MWTSKVENGDGPLGELGHPFSMRNYQWKYLSSAFLIIWKENKREMWWKRTILQECDGFLYNVIARPRQVNPLAPAISSLAEHWKWGFCSLSMSLRIKMVTQITEAKNVWERQAGVSFGGTLHGWYFKMLMLDGGKCDTYYEIISRCFWHLQLPHPMFGAKETQRQKHLLVPCSAFGH